MPIPSAKELYMMNGGNKLYIYKDGFGDVYNATPGEEREWAQEVIANALEGIDKGENTTCLKLDIESLVFHKYEGVEALLINKMKEASPSRQIVFATALWNMSGYENSFEIIYQNLLQHRGQCLDDVFWGLNGFKDNAAARHFLIGCLEGDDDVLLAKAQTTITMWAYSGVPALRENNLLEMLRLENKKAATFKPAIEQLKEILFSRQK